MNKYSKLPLREGVGVVVLNEKNEIFVAKRIDNPKNFWQMPQGGIDKGEKPIDAAYRELYEETNIKSVKFLKEVEKELEYILPDRLLGIIWKGRFKGQKQKWFIMRFIGDEKEINIKTDNPEFLDWKWIKIEDLNKVAVSFKLHIYKYLKSEIKKYLINS